MLGVLEQSNIVLSVLWLRESKQQDKSCFGSALSLGLKVLSCLVFIAHETIYCALQGLFWIPLHFLWKLTIHHYLWTMHWSPRHIPLSLITDVTSNDTTACFMAMQGERTDRSFCKTRLLDGLRKMILLDKQGLYFPMSVSMNGSKRPSRGSGCHNIFFLGEEEGRVGREGERFCASLYCR